MNNTVLGCAAVIAAAFATPSLSLDLQGEKYTKSEVVIEGESPHRARRAAALLDDGIGYNRWDDGSAWFRPMQPDESPEKPKYETHSAARGWQVECRVDAMSDDKSCRLSQQSVRVVVLSPRCEVAVGVGSDHFPRKPVMIRFDKGAPIQAKEGRGIYSGKDGASVVARMKAAPSMRTRHYEWPYADSPVDAEIDLKGFRQALDYGCWAVKRL